MDEPTHLMAGFSYLDTGDFRLNPEHPPLAKMWAALPLALGGVESISRTSTRWRLGRQRELGYEFVNGSFDNVRRADPATRLVPARMTMVALGIGLGIVVYAWARAMWGAVGALVALALYALSPTVLAHTRLVTTDVPAAMGFTCVVWSFWRFCRAPRWQRVLPLGLSLGVALLLKFSTILLAPVLVALLALWVMFPDNGAEGWRRRLGAGTGALAAAALMAIVIVWAGYGFRYRATVSGEYSLPWAEVSRQDGLPHTVIGFVRERRWLPESYLFGLAYVAGHSDRRTFINGQILDHGSWLFFPEAFAIKSTPALLAIVAWLIILGLRPRRWSLSGWFLALSILIYLAVSMASRLNIGHRHLLPIYPLIFIAAGCLGRIATAHRTAAWTLAMLLAGHGVSSAVAFPRYLSYFNAIAGGPAGGWRYLVDSNIDWGQDLARLGRWLRAHDVRRVYLAYFGSADPASYGIAFQKVYQVEDFEPGIPGQRPGPGEYLAASVTLLQGLYVTDASSASWLARVRTELEPVGKAGDSILIYRIPPTFGPE
jgi:4-amino-4-deoxy-L-arabinose transferase-like glycosyltransferase